MSELVDYGKRDPLLPEGCKDLTDLWARNPGDKTSQPTGSLPRVTAKESGSFKVRELGSWISRWYESEAHVSFLQLSPPGGDIEISFSGLFVRPPMPNFLERRDVTIYVTEGSGKENAVREFFIACGLTLPVFGPGSPTIPDAPVKLIYEVKPMPGSWTELLRLMEALLHRVCGLNESADLIFEYDEMEQAGK